MTDNNNGNSRMPPPPPGMLVGYPDANQQALLVAQGMAAAAQVAPQIVGTVQPSSKPQVVGRRGDPRMHRAVEIRLANPKMTLVDALRQGGFIFHRVEGGGQSDRTVRDMDNVLLYQRKNQLNRRLRKIKKQHPAASGGPIVDDNGDESDDEREDDDEEDEDEADSRRKRRGRSRSGKSKSAHKAPKKKKRRSKKSGHRSSSQQQQQQMSAMMPPLPFPPIPPPMQMPGGMMDPASMAQFQQAYMAQQAAMMQAAAVQAAALASANNTAEGGDDGQQAGGPPPSAQPNPAGAAAMSPAMLGALMASNPMMWAAFQPQAMAAAGPGGTGMPPLQQPPAVPQFVFPPQLQAAMMQAASTAASVSVVPAPAGGKGPDGEDDGDDNEGDAEEDPVEGEDDVKATV